MKYINNTIRRQDRTMDESRAIELIRTSEYGVLSMVDENGEAYGVPVNYIWDGKTSLYIHCAPEGRKLRAIASNNIVSFCIIGNVNLLPSQFTTEYESVVIKGKATADLDREERMKALHLLVDKYSPDYHEIGLKYSEKSFHRVSIIRIDMMEYSGKCKHIAKK